MTPHRAIIVEDEKLARNRLKKLLANYTDEIEIIAEADNGEEGYKLVNELHPDLIFLDIQMPVLTGFEMLKKLTHKPKIIFTTAYERYAIKAFEENSIDYLLKPIREERLDLTIKKLRDQTDVASSSSDESDKILQYLEALQPRKELSSITVTVGDRIIIVKLDWITYFHANEKYVFIREKKGQEHIIDHSLTSLEEQLPKYFLRVHRAYIINTNMIQEIRKSFNGRFVFYMSSGEKITCGSSYIKKIKERLHL